MLKIYISRLGPQLQFREGLPPFRTMTADERGSLYFVSPSTPIDVVARNGSFYYVRETESGFKQLVTERIIIQ